MSGERLTAAERADLRPHVGLDTGAIKTVERIVAARVAEAVERERAAWATKIERLVGEWLAEADRARTLRGRF